MSTAPLLVELLTEELPPRALRQLSEAFAQALVTALRTQGFAPATGTYTAYASPRRLAVLIGDVAGRAPDRVVLAKGPSVKAGTDDAGKPTPALLGFARKQGANVEALERHHDGKNEIYVYRKTEIGSDLRSAVAAMVENALRHLPIPKMMRWGDGDAQFVRPVRGVVLLHGERVIDACVMGLAAGRATRGHRFLGAGTIELSHAADYEAMLAQDGKVIASFDRRLALIKAGLQAAAAGATIAADEALYAEVAALVEYPAVYEGRFDAGFLDVPQECLMLTMRQNQKYFPLLGTDGKLLNRFLLVSNMEAADPGQIVRGNERVLRARLSDAKFFYDQDRRQRLETLVPQLAHVVYHNKLGSQLERVARIEALAPQIAARLNTDQALARSAAYLAKADLLTGMVGEFPELQGVMGQYYARHDGEPEAVAAAIEAHYRPRFAGDDLPTTRVGDSVALADKLDTLVGIWGAGLAPTGDKDPFALRRTALGVLRILIEHELPLDLPELLRMAQQQLTDKGIEAPVADEVYAFMLDRLRSYLREREFTVDEIEAVVSQEPARIDRVVPRLEAVRIFRRLPEADSLAAANKRIRNILKKAPVVHSEPDPTLLRDAAERTLYDALRTLTPHVEAHLAAQRYTEALTELAHARAAVDRFFDEVLVMAPEAGVRDNRLALLASLDALMNRVADISKLAA